MNLEKDTAPTGLYNYLPKSRRRTAWQKRTGLKGIGPLKQGLLKKVGYSSSASVTRRHAAVKRAVKKYGRASTIRKLNAVAVYTRKRAPKTSRKFKADMKFAQKLKGGMDKEDVLNDVTFAISENKLGERGRPSVELKEKANQFVSIHPADKLGALYGKLKGYTPTVDDTQAARALQNMGKQKNIDLGQ